MEVVRARLAGFCMGVGLALKKLNALLDRAEREATSGCRPIFMLGPIIHNPQVLAHYAALGVRQADVPEDIPPGGRAVIRAHGIPRETEAALVARGVEIVDATCPKVKRAQLLIAKQAQSGRTLLLFGENDHPEVRGLLSYAGPDACVFENVAELSALEFDPVKSYFLAAQTTQDRGMFQRIKAQLAKRLPAGLPILETICDATRLRQEEAIRLAGGCGMVIVAGGKTSGNTRRLAQVVEAAGTPALLVENVDELRSHAIGGKISRMGLTAGASTPKDIIDAIEAYLLAL